jgi:hypothetical protein
MILKFSDFISTLTDFSTLFEITLLDVFLSSFRYEKIEKKNSKLKFKMGVAWIFLVFRKDIFIMINKIYTFCIVSESCVSESGGPV